MTDQPRSDRYLIVKRGLYYRPQSAGYTGLKEQAGRYTFDEVAVHFPNMDSPNQDGMSFVHESDADEYSPACPWDLRLKHKAYTDGKADAESAVNIIAEVCAEMTSNGFAHSPRVVCRADFDLSNFKEQESDFEGVQTEWVNQSGPGICGDDFTGTLAVPIDANRLFVIDYAS